MPVPISYDGDVAVLRLDLPRGNAIDQAFIRALDGSLDEVEKTAARALVLTGRDRIFCGGLDLVELATFDRAQLFRYVEQFEGLVQRVFTFPIPTVAAINGHALAGGFVLAMSCDLRVMASGGFHIGCNEVQLGMPLAPAAFEIVRHATPGPWRAPVLAQGRRFSPTDAYHAGIVHRLAGEFEPVTASIEEARLFASASPPAVRWMRAEHHARVLARISTNHKERTSQFVDAWFLPETQERIGAVRAQLAAKTGKR